MVGWATPVFAVAATLAVVVIYDAAGVRRQAGIHAQTINVLVQEVLQGHPISDNGIARSSWAHSHRSVWRSAMGERGDIFIVALLDLSRQALSSQPIL